MKMTTVNGKVLIFDKLHILKRVRPSKYPPVAGTNKAAGKIINFAAHQRSRKKKINDYEDIITFGCLVFDLLTGEVDAEKIESFLRANERPDFGAPGQTA